VLGDRPTGAGVLAECLFDPDTAVRRQAVESLAGGGGKGKAEEVRRALEAARDDPAPAVRWAAVRQLAPADPAAAALLVDLASKGGPADRVEAARVLGKTAGPAARRLLEEIESDLRADDPDDRIEAAVTLLRLDPGRAGTVLPLLLGILEGWDEPARFGAARALGSLGQLARPALPALRRRLERDDSEAVRRAVEAAIASIQGK
jgi:HEAT repeat protein